MDVIYDQLQRKEISGITLSGGDPLYQAKDLVHFLKQIRFEFPDLECLDYIDVLIDGPYEQELNPGPGKVLWRGSTNQRIIDLNKTRQCGKIVLLYD